MITDSVKSIRGLVEGTQTLAACSGLSVEMLQARMRAVLRHCDLIDDALASGRMTARAAFVPRLALPLSDGAPS